MQAKVKKTSKLLITLHYQLAQIDEYINIGRDFDFYGNNV